MGLTGLILLSALATAGAADVAWDTIIRLTNDPASQVTGYSSQHSVAVDAAGNVHVVWLDQRDVPSQVWYRRYDDGTSTWLAETALTTQQANCSRPGVACDSAGNIHVVWHVGSWNPLGVGIWSKRYNATTHHWRADTLIDSTSTSQPQQNPSVACAPGAGDAQAAWCRLPDTGMYTQAFLRERHPATGWDSVVQVSSSAVSHDQVSVATGRNGDLAVVWVGKDFSDDYNQVYCRRRVAGAWQGVELVSDIPLGLSQYSPCVAIDRRGAVHVVWYGRSMMNTYQQVFHRECDSAGWSGVDSISGERAYQQQYPSIACDEAGRCHAVWCSAAGSGHTQLVYGQRDANGIWSSPMILTNLDSGDISYPSITCDADSGIHILWYDDHNGNQDVYYLRGFAPGAALSEMPNAELRAPKVGPTIIRGDIPQTAARKPPTGGVILDACGRVAEGSAPGLYFIREPGGARLQKLVVVR